MENHMFILSKYIGSSILSDLFILNQGFNICTQGFKYCSFWVLLLCLELGTDWISYFPTVSFYYPLNCHIIINIYHLKNKIKKPYGRKAICYLYLAFLKFFFLFSSFFFVL
jgi:hypothetical protein